MKLIFRYNRPIKRTGETPFGWGTMVDLVWDEPEWKARFNEACRLNDWNGVRSLRRDVFFSTLELIDFGRGYTTTEGLHVDLPLNETLTEDTLFYSCELPAVTSAGEGRDTLIEVVCEDCLTLARNLRAKEGEVCVLNMASRRNPGGGVINGMGAQEEYLFRCSDYFRSLYQFASYAEQYGIQRSPNQYPLDRDWGGIFSPGVTIFRGTETEGYRLLNHPWRANFIAVAGINNPQLILQGDEERVVSRLVDPIKNKMRTILRIAAHNGQRVLVLGALGCGAFHNPPKHTAELFYEVLHEDEFSGVFRHVAFAIKEDHNSPAGGNYEPFANVFNQ